MRFKSAVTALLLMLCGCGQRQSMDVSAIFREFTYEGHYPARREFDVRPSEILRGERPPQAPQPGIAYIYRKRTKMRFFDLADKLLSARLRSEGFTLSGSTPGFVEFDPKGAMFFIDFKKGSCTGVLFGDQLPTGDEYYVL
jgi:hypothetical protein